MLSEAIIIAGGQGTRLMPLTLSKPKALVKIAGTPLVERQLDWLVQHGITHIIIATGFMHDKIAKWTRQYRRIHPNISIELSRELEPLGTGGAVKKAMQLLHYETPFACLNVDDLSDVNLGVMHDLFLKFGQGFDACLAVANPSLGFGTIEFNDEHDRVASISSFKEKPLLKDKWVSIGVYILRKSILAKLPDIGMIETVTFPHTNNLAFKHQGKWQPITSCKDVDEFANKWSSSK